MKNRHDFPTSLRDHASTAAEFHTLVLARHALDPFPFIFLNLTLSMVAAFQAPIIHRLLN